MTTLETIDLGVDSTDFLVPTGEQGFNSPIGPEQDGCKALFEAVQDQNKGLLEVVTGLVEVYLHDPMFEPLEGEPVDMAPLLRLLGLPLHPQASDAERLRAPSVRVVAYVAKTAAGDEGLSAVQTRTEMRRPRLYAYLGKTSWMPVNAN